MARLLFLFFFCFLQLYGVYVYLHTPLTFYNPSISAITVVKCAYGGLVELKMRVGINHTNKLEALEAYPLARIEDF